jgi:hypothetical protein
MQCAIDGRNWREDGDLFLALAIGVHDAASAELAAKLWDKLWDKLWEALGGSFGTLTKF